MNRRMLAAMAGTSVMALATAPAVAQDRPLPPPPPSAESEPSPGGGYFSAEHPGVVHSIRRGCR